ncbi:MAG: M48 family metallopeptidase [Gammaproteobacteria bacterium]
MSARIAALGLLAALGLAACATSPTGRTQLLAFSEQSAIAASKQAYTEMLAPLAEGKKIDNDAALVQRVQPIVDRIVEQAIIVRPETRDWDWELKVIDDPKTVNAWAMAGGKMALYSGLVEVVEPTDDELAQVLAHEVAHALAKHSVEKMSVAAATQLGMEGIAVATGAQPIVMQGSALVAAVAISLPNSRTMETEADRIGIEIAAKAGFDPRAAATLWQKMAAAGGSQQPQFLSTHPNPATRKATLEALAPEMMPFYEQARGH